MGFLLHVTFMIGVFALMSMGLELLVGEMGMPVLGQAGFALVGAYTAALMSIHWAINAPVGLLCGSILAGVVGGLVAWPCLRLRGDYLALATLGFGVIIHSVAHNWVSLTRGPLGLTGVPNAGALGFVLEARWQYAVLVWVLVGGCYGLLGMLLERPFGLVVRAIREDETATLSLGKPAPRFKLRAFFLGASIAGLAGGLYGYYLRFLHPDTFAVPLSLTLLLIVTVGGLGSLKGSVAGACLLTALPEALRFLGVSTVDANILQQIVFGVLLVLLILFRPQGIFGRYAWK